MSGVMSALHSTPPLKSGLQRYRVLSKNCGLRVSPLCIGGMNFGLKWQELMGSCSKETTFAILDEYYRLGGNFIDTAVNYQGGESEEYIGDWIRERKIPREDLVIATKFSIPPRPGSVNHGGNSKKNMTTCLEMSLKRLGVDYIDLYYVHYWDYSTSPREVMRSLDDFVKQGKILFPGISDTPAWIVSRLNTYAEENCLSPFVMYQGLYNFGTRDMESDIIPMCKEMGLGVIPWGILGTGKYSGKYSRSTGNTPTSISHRPQNLSEKDWQIIDVLDKVAAKHSCTPSAVCLAWGLAQKDVPSLLVGCRTLEQLRDNVKALEITLDDEDMKALGDVSSSGFGFPHNFLGGTTPEGVPWIRPAGSVTRNF
ncbi:sterigmatocystin biosynthesis dehydrogenase stcV [Gonapodya prolifera JEL478]|uniref:Sterigmatocystin biosynthesis dehydrogenase stcV n=1 Tax=Gonapodya prolifera (strain JEL478) TaxID=1344416 RepID=A0A139AVX8_GONPJ|nr:sterigmatocystin biosynthesis dehydrogenase stcV [Gonapodya prolifera JEL478]|eukprot:KXS20625.1 sterigmatocystin biosynthesis dehydrogenase stcV [Gonapodya prolifera JEL478]